MGHLVAWLWGAKIEATLCVIKFLHTLSDSAESKASSLIGIVCSEFPVKGQRRYGSLLSAFMRSSVLERKGWQYLFIWGSLENSCENEAVFHGCHPSTKCSGQKG